MDKRAEFAYKCVCEVKKESGIKNEEYKSYVKNIPMLIKTNGLGATYAYVYSKKARDSSSGKAYQKIYDDTMKWLKFSDKVNKLINLKEDKSELVEELIKLDSSKYRIITIEVLMLFQWLRRFAEGMLGVDVNE